MCGDVMTGRGIDQILPHPGDARIYEDYMTSALGYVRIAGQASGPIPVPVDFSYIWGDALEELQRIAPDCRIINLETAVTKGGRPEAKGINYRMHPDNIPCITAAHVDCCCLANNHVLDWGYDGLLETLDTLEAAGLKYAGAGRNLEEAEAPAVLAAGEKGRVLVFSLGEESGGIPPHWAAEADRPGVNLLPNLSGETVRRVGEKVKAVKRFGDVAVASIHWGGNWGYEIPRGQRDFAHRLIDHAAIDIVHGHSSHHVKGMEVHRGKLVLYGCGDFLNDYEGIGGMEDFRADLGLMYFAWIDPGTGRLADMKMIPISVRRFRVNRASKEGAIWLRDTLNREGIRLGTAVELGEDGVLRLSTRPGKEGFRGRSEGG